MNIIIPQIDNKFKFNLFPFIYEVKNFLETVSEINSAYLFDSLAFNVFEFNIVEIHMVIVYNKMSSKYSCFVKNQIEIILNKFLIDYHLNLIQVCVGDLEANRNVSFILKTKSIPFMISSKGSDIRKNINNFSLSNFPKINLHYIKQNKSHPKIKKEYYFLAKKNILSLYEKYIDDIKVWLISYYDIINKLQNLQKSNKMDKIDSNIFKKSVLTLKYN